MLVLPQILLDARPQNAGAFPVNDVNLVQPGQHRLVQIQPHGTQCLLQAHSPNVAFRFHRPGHHPRLCFYGALLRRLRRLNHPKLADVRLEFHRPGLQGNLPLFVRAGEHRAFRSQRQNPNPVAGLHGLRRFAVLLAFLSQAFAHLVNPALQPPAKLCRVSVSGRVFLHFLQLGDHGLAFPPRLLKNPFCFLPGLPQGRFPFVFHLPAQLLRFVPKSDRFLSGLLGNLPFPLRHLPVIFRIGNHVFKANCVTAQQLSRRVNQVLRQSQPPADFKGVALSRYSDGKPVGGPQGLHVEFNRGVLHALRRQCKDLQLAVVGCRHGPHADVQQPGQDALCQRRALRRVRSGPEFVKQHQIPRRHFPHDRNDVRHVPAEGGKALLNALLVSDVGKHLLENRQFRAHVRRNLQARLGHQRKKPHRLQRHGLAARVRSGHDQRREFLSEPDGLRHNLFRVNQRMPSPDDVKIPFPVHLRANAYKPSA